MMRKPCLEEVLVAAPYGTISRCACGTYYVRFYQTTICFTAFEFERVARLFKISLGMLSAKAVNPRETEAYWGTLKAKISG